MSCSAVAGDQLDCICGKTGRYELNSPFHYALLRLAAELPNSTASSSELFTTATVGEVPEAVVAGATCRRDADASLCKDCVLAALKEGMQTCVYDKSVTVYTDHCTIRYSNEDFIAEGFRDFNWYSSNATVPVPEEFTISVEGLLYSVFNYTAAAVSKFGTGIQEGKGILSNNCIYALAQCQPSMSREDCVQCLTYLQRRMPLWMGSNRDGRMRTWLCSYRFDDYHFFSGDPIIRLPGTPGKFSHSTF